MKKILLSAALLAGLFASAQLNSSSDGYVLDLTDASSQCLINVGLPNNGGQMNGDANTFATGANLTATGYEFVSVTGIADLDEAVAQWFALPYIDDESCTNLNGADIGVDLTNATSVSIDVSSDQVGSQLELFLGGEGKWGPSSSTYNNGQGVGIDAISTIEKAGVVETFVFDLAALGGSDWTDWAGKNKIQSVGFRSLTDGATFTVTAVKFGVDADSVDDGNDDDGNDDDNGNDDGENDCDGAVTDHGHGTWYDNLDVQPNGVVKCSFERSDILGTKYGALDKGLLIDANGGTPYCGMCVEAIAPEHNNTPTIIQIVDECPDCMDRGTNGEILTTNTKFGDIDLSIAAFKALLQEDHVALGIGDFEWKEVSCPWTTNMHLIVQGSHDWYAKVIVGNHKNRIASVEISADGTSWLPMGLGVDNGWTKGSLGGQFKSFKITDIYGSELIISDIDMVDGLIDGAGKFDGGSNFPACTATSTGELVNSLNYVSAYPNPANTNITFAGVEDAQAIEILNINGQVVASKFLNNETAQISLDISNLASGIYVAKMIGNNSTGAVTFVKK
ncbi:T9SS type A sorting domain-containing protein [Flavobacteriales bacterium]|nr:T9SS type A sorting domain-containing protein [Flavobacteriales bacterium]